MSLGQSLGWRARLVQYPLAQTEWEEVILKLVEHNPDARLLSLGYGDGAFTSRVAHRIGTAHVSAIEIVPEYVKAAQARGIAAVAGDLNARFPFDDESFDVVLSNHDIEHVSNTDRLLQECRRMLKKGGYMVISTPNLGALHNLVFLLLGKQPLMAEVSDEAIVGNWGTPRRRVTPAEPAHRRLFTASALRELLQWHRFRVERVIRSGFRPFPGPLARILAAVFPLYSTTITAKARKA